MDFKISTKKNKKYMVKLKDGKVVHFGDKRFSQYKDTTGVGAYSHLDHLDMRRRENYKSRHEKTRHIVNSPSWFSDKFLW